MPLLTLLAFGFTILPQAISIASGRQQSVSMNTRTGNLSGTLKLPPGRGPFPVALIIAGSGPVNRDGNSPKAGLNTDCYKQLAEALAGRGIASLRYDKRGVGQSATAGLGESELRVSTYADDAIAWGRKLRGDVRFSTVTVVGHSEGSLIAMIAAGEAPVDGLVSVAGAGEPLPALMLKQLEAQLPPDAYTSANKIIGSLEHGIPVTHVPPLLEPVLRPSVQPYLISLFRYDPRREIAKLEIPVLIVQGEQDVQVGASDATSLAKALPSARLTLIHDMNHVLKSVTSLDDNLTAYHDPTTRLNPQLVDAVSDFVHQLRR